MQNTAVLFDMPQEPYVRLDEAYGEYECLCAMFDVYEKQKEARKEWAKTLWSKLDPQLLMEGIEAFIRQFKQLPRTCRAVPAGVALDTVMKKFKNSVPLFIELKNDAMRENHWQELMDQTGTLENTGALA